MTINGIGLKMMFWNYAFSVWRTDGNTYIRATFPDECTEMEFLPWGKMSFFNSSNWNMLSSLRSGSFVKNWENEIKKKRKGRRGEEKGNFPLLYSSVFSFIFTQFSPKWAYLQAIYFLFKVVLYVRIPYSYPDFFLPKWPKNQESSLCWW